MYNELVMFLRLASFYSIPVHRFDLVSSSSKLMISFFAFLVFDIMEYVYSEQHSFNDEPVNLNLHVCFKYTVHSTP